MENHHLIIWKCRDFGEKGYKNPGRQSSFFGGLAWLLRSQWHQVRSWQDEVMEMRTERWKSIGFTFGRGSTLDSPWIYLISWRVNGVVRNYISSFSPLNFKKLDLLFFWWEKFPLVSCKIRPLRSHQPDVGNRATPSYPIMSHYLLLMSHNYYGWIMGVLMGL